MSAVPEVLTDASAATFGAPGVDDLTPAPRTTPEVDCVEFLPLECEEMRAVARASGPVFAAWERYWQTLAMDERDPLSYPAWVAGRLQGQLCADQAGSTRVLVTLGGGQVLGLLPVTAPRPGVLEHARGFNSKSWALARRDHLGAMGALFGARMDGRRVRSLHLDGVEQTSGLLQATWPSFHHRLWYRSLIDLDDGYEGLLARLSSNGRKSVRRLRKRIARDHEIELQALSAPEDLDAAFELYLQVDERSWKHDGGSTLRASVREREAMRAALDHMALEGRAAVHILRADGVPIAAQLGAVVDRQLLVVKTSFDADWANYGAGKLLLSETMRLWCPEHGIRSVNLVTGLDWHRRWAPRQLETRSLWLFASGRRGRLARLLDVPVREDAKAALRALHLERAARRLTGRT